MSQKTFKTRKVGESLGPLAKEDMMFTVPMQYMIAVAEDLFWHISDELEKDKDYDMESAVVTAVYGKYAYHFRFIEGEIDCVDHERVREEHEQHYETTQSHFGDTKIVKHPTFGVEIPQIIKERVAC